MLLVNIPIGVIVLLICAKSCASHKKGNKSHSNVFSMELSPAEIDELFQKQKGGGTMKQAYGLPLKHMFFVFVTIQLFKTAKYLLLKHFIKTNDFISLPEYNRMVLCNIVFTTVVVAFAFVVTQNILIVNLCLFDELVSSTMFMYTHNPQVYACPFYLLEMALE